MSTPQDPNVPPGQPTPSGQPNWYDQPLPSAQPNPPAPPAPPAQSNPPAPPAPADQAAWHQQPNPLGHAPDAQPPPPPPPPPGPVGQPRDPLGANQPPPIVAPGSSNKVAKILRIAVPIVVAVVGVLFILLRPSGPNLTSGDCLTGMQNVEKVPCSSPDAVWKIGDGCDAMLEITMNGGKDSYCASKIEE